MKKWKLFILCSLVFSFGAEANYLDEHLKKMDWHGLEVQWIKDQSTPLYDVMIKFQAGALMDDKSRYGETQSMFSNLVSGTTQYGQKEIADHLEFYGTDFDLNVTHEYVVLNVRGLVKDIMPTMKMVCHLFKRATFPESELALAKSRYVTSLKNLHTNPGSMAERAFRQISLKQTDFWHPTDGTLKSINNISSEHLKEKLEYFNKKVAKKIFLVGPSEVNQIKDIFKNDCEWTASANVVHFGKPVEKKYSKKGNKIHFVKVDNLNQAQVRIGSHLTVEQINESPDYLRFASTFLGGGFTSQLMTELRVNRGLTYGAGSMAAGQKNYGRALISTYTKNESLVELLKITREVISMKDKNYSDDVISRSKKYAKGNYLFGLESLSGFMQNLIYFDHIGRDYSEIYQYPKSVDKITQDELKAKLADVFSWDSLAVVILGDPSLVPVLKAAGYNVVVHSYQDYL